MSPEQTIHAFLADALTGVSVFGGRLPAGWRNDSPACVWTLASQAPAHGRVPMSRCTLYLSFYGARDDLKGADDISWAAYEALHGASTEAVLRALCVTRGMAARDPETAWPVARATYQLWVTHPSE